MPSHIGDQQRRGRRRVGPLDVRARRAGLVDRQRVRDRLVSVAGLIGRPVRLSSGEEVGRVVDVVVRLAAGTYPPMAGAVVRVGRRRAFVPVDDIAEITGLELVLSSPRLDVRDFVRRDDEVALMGEVVDRQLVDVDDVQVVRASDLYLADVLGKLRLVGVEVGVLSLLRRLGPARRRARATPERVIDWGDVHAVLWRGAVRLDVPASQLRRLRPGDLADLLEGLSRPHRDAVVGVLDPDVAADVLEEMDEAQRDAVLRSLDTAKTAEIIAAMEPDEAAEALRELDDAIRGDVLALMSIAAREPVERLLAYDEATAGGIMTTVVVTANARDTVAAVVEKLTGHRHHRSDIDAVLVVDDDGALIDDVSLFELLTAAPTTTMDALVGPPWPLTLAPDAGITEVVDAVLSNRSSSVVVIDAEGRPLGRVLADDALDALTATRPLLHRDVGHA